MKIYLASDHAGFDLKAKLGEWLRDSGHDVHDLGPRAYDPTDDYPDLVTKAARAVAGEPESRAVVIGGSGEGEAMAANRLPGVRAAVLYAYDEGIIRLTREHNDANVLALGARFLSETEAKDAVRLWLQTPFSEEERHTRRIKKLDAGEA